MGQTKIEWATKTWNIVEGCTKVSAGCKHCYAERLSKRMRRDFNKVELYPDRLEEPLRWRKPQTVFVCSRSDLFHEDVPDEFIEQVFAVMGRTKHHTFQVLTKRPERMREYFTHRCGELEALAGIAGKQATATVMSHIWLGVSVENQARADERIPILLDTPAAVRFVSAEPLLGPIKFDHRHMFGLMDIGMEKFKEGTFLDWVIVGGESGGPPERRLVERPWNRIYGDWCPKPEALEWVRKIRDDCQAAGTPFFWKQWGPRAGQGTLLDGREWREMPEVRA